MDNIIRYFMNAVVLCFGFICITKAAMFFENANVLWWYLILIFIGALSSGTEITNNKNNKNREDAE